MKIEFDAFFEKHIRIKRTYSLEKEVLKRFVMTMEDVTIEEFLQNPYPYIDELSDFVIREKIPIANQDDLIIYEFLNYIDYESIRGEYERFNRKSK